MRSLLAILLAVLGPCAFAAIAGAGDDVAADPERVPWQRLRYEASKLLVTARAEVELERDADAPPGDDGDRPRGADLVLVMRSSLLGKHSTSRLWLDPATGAVAFQERRETGRDDEYRTYRYDRGGTRITTLEPADDAQAALAPQRWTGRRDVERVAYGERPADGEVTVAGALLYLVPALPLDRPGDAATVLVLSRRRLVTAHMKAEEWVELRPRFTVDDGDGRSRVQEGPLRLLRVQVGGRSADGSAADLKLFGLDGDVDLYLDPRTRVPVRVSGRLPYVGRLDVELQEVVLAEPAVAAGAP